MFEDSLMESRGRFASKSRRWITVGSIGLQCLIATGFVLIPILHPEALPFRAIAPIVVVPVLKKPPVVIVEQRPRIAAQANAIAVPSVMVATRVAVLPTMRPVDPEMATGAAVPSDLVGMASPGSGSELFGALNTGPTRITVAAPRRTKPLPVSSGVLAGLLVGEIRPVYPRIAVVAHVEGAVVIEATISKQGTIESAHVVSGPAMLAGAAIRCGQGCAVSALSA